MTAADGIQKLEQRAEAFAHARSRVLLLAVAILGVALGWFGHRPTQPSIPVADAATRDSFAFTAPIFRATNDSLGHAETDSARHATAAVSHVRSQLHATATFKQLGDSLETQAEIHHDTAAITWEGIAVVRSAEADSAVAAVDSLQVALIAEHMARLAADARASLDSTRLVALTAFNAKLLGDLAKSDPPCRLLFMHCPSRVAVGVTGVVVYAIAREVLPHLLKP